MTWKCSAILALCIAASGCQSESAQQNSAPANANAAGTTAKSAPTDLKELARRVVAQNVNVKEGEIVRITGSPRDMELLENIFIEVEKVGAHPMLSVTTESLAKRHYAEVPEKFDSQDPKLSLALARIINVEIGVDGLETEGLLADVPPARFAARAKGNQAIAAEYIKNKIRTVSIGNGLYPTAWLAGRFEMAPDAFANMFWRGVNVDYSDLQKTGEAARTALTGNEIVITHPNGTDLRINVQGRPIYIGDGVISDEDMRKGNYDVFLPAGEAAITPVANSGDGKFVVDKQYFDGKEVTNLTFTFAGGKLVSLTGGGPGFEMLKQSYEAFPEGKELLGFVDVGLNNNMKAAPNAKLGNWVSAGMVSVGTGGNSWAGGSSNASGGVLGQLPGATVKIDGKVVVENGVLKL